MDVLCRHLDAIHDVDPSATACLECTAMGSRWVHLRRCTTCGHVGCCDLSPNRHATAHHGESGHPVVQSYEPDEDWYWCYDDEVAFELPGSKPSASHP